MAEGPDRTKLFGGEGSVSIYAYISTIYSSSLWVVTIVISTCDNKASTHARILYNGVEIGGCENCGTPIMRRNWSTRWGEFAAVLPKGYVPPSAPSQRYN
ncbi:hypothetical protein Leryth_007081 [Lithospermum erythrorhizon]|nr:hypothetical protein Leryth_007081 [Lithospermum erythrorhizon]